MTKSTEGRTPCGQHSMSGPTRACPGWWTIQQQARPPAGPVKASQGTRWSAHVLRGFCVTSVSLKTAVLVLELGKLRPKGLLGSAPRPAPPPAGLPWQSGRSQVPMEVTAGSMQTWWQEQNALQGRPLRGALTGLMWALPWQPPCQARRAARPPRPQVGSVPRGDVAAWRRRLLSPHAGLPLRDQEKWAGFYWGWSVY